MDRPASAASRLAELTEQGADRFDPVGFHFIDSLVRRSMEKPAPVRRCLERKALEALDDFQVRFETARQEAAHHVSRTAEANPDAARQIRARFDQGDFQGVRRLAERNDRGCGRSVLAMLSDEIARAGHLAGENAALFSLDTLMQRQEEAVVGSLGRSTTAQDSPSYTPTPSLRAFQLFERAWATHHADTLVAHAVNHIPENPGHLNSQMLATRCLSAMHKLAPAYLCRWVTYMETLLWLEGAGRDDSRPITAKAGR